MHYLYSFLSQLGQDTSTETTQQVYTHFSVFDLGGLLFIPISSTSSTLFSAYQLSREYGLCVTIANILVVLVEVVCVRLGG